MNRLPATELAPIVEFAPELGWIVVAADVTLKFTLVLLAAAVMTLALRRASAALRHRIWSLALASGLAIPLLAGVMPQWQAPILPAWLADRIVQPVEKPVVDAPRFAPTPVVPLEPMTLPSMPVSELPPPRPIDRPADFDLEPIAVPQTDTKPLPVTASAPTKGSETDHATSLDVPRIILFVWLLGVAVGVMRLSTGAIFNAWLLSGARPMVDAVWQRELDAACRALALRRRVRLFVIDRNVIPMTWGVWRPLILLPSSSQIWSPWRRRIVLLHETAHIARFDLPMQWLARCVCAAYWFHPLVWLAIVRLRIEREFACDDAVVNAGERATDYASELVAIAETHRMPRFSSALTMARSSHLEGRLRSLFDRARSHQPLHTKAAVALVVVASLVATSLAMMEPVGRGVDNSVDESIPSDDAPPEATDSITVANQPRPDEIQHKIKGQCLEEDEKTVVAGAEVKAYHLPHDAPPVLLAETVTDEAGRFMFGGLGEDIARRHDRASVSLRLIATHARHVTNIYRLELHDDRPNEFVEKPLRLFMSHEISTFSGIVRDAKGSPVADALIGVTPNSGLSVGVKFEQRFHTHIHHTSTDENGRFAIDNLRRNLPYKLVVTFPPAENRSDANVEYPVMSTQIMLENIPQELDIALPSPPGIVEGFVLDADNEQALPGVLVKAEGNSGYMSQETRTDAKGRYRLALSPDTYSVSAESDDRLALKRDPVQLEQGETEWNVDIRMKTPVTVSGTILDADGKPHDFGKSAGAYSVFLRGPMHKWIHQPLKPDGTYEVQVLAGKNLFMFPSHDASVYVDIPDENEYRLDIVSGQDTGRDDFAKDSAKEHRVAAERPKRVLADAAAKETENKTTQYKPTEILIKARQAVKRGIEYLLSQQNDDGTWTARENFTIGTTALCTFALLEAGVAKDHPQIVKALDYLAAQQPDKTYEIATQTLAFCAADAKKYREQIQRNVDWLQDAQLSTGTWDYGAINVGTGDRSNAEFAIWALDEAAYAGARVDDETWRRAREHFVSSQNGGGGWGYSGLHNQASSGSMTCAGIASLVICLDHLDDDESEEYKQAALAVERGFKWLSKHFAAGHNPGNPNWHLYYLMLLRRVGELTGATLIGEDRRSWEEEVNEFLVTHASQRDGSWTDNRDSQLATAFALLTLKDDNVRAWIFKRKRVRGKVGRVVDEQGQPLRNGPVVISWAIAGLGQDTLHARTNDDGEFEFYYPPTFVTYLWRAAFDSDGIGGINPEIIEHDPLVLRVPRIRNSIFGIWKVVPNENKNYEQTFEPGTEVFIDQNKLTYWFDLNTDSKMQEEEYKVDAFHTPAHIDITFQDATRLGVFEVEHDRVVLCLAYAEVDRPATIMPESDTRTYSILTLQRIDVRKTVAPMFDFKNISPQESRIFDALRESTQTDFNEIPFRDSIQFLGDQHAVTFVIDVVGLEAAGIDPELPVTLTLSNVSLHEALEMILRPLKLRYLVEDDVIKITAK